MRFFQSRTWYLLRTMGVTSASMFTGDFICQKIRNPKGSWEKSRSLTLGITGLFVTGPAIHCIFLIMEKLFAGKSSNAIVHKLIGNRTLAFVQTGLTFSTVVLLQGGGWNEVKKKLRQDLGSTWMIGNLFWVPVNFAQYKWLPVYARAPVSSAAGMFWNIFLAYQLAKPIKNKHA